MPFTGVAELRSRSEAPLCKARSKTTHDNAKKTSLAQQVRSVPSNGSVDIGTFAGHYPIMHTRSLLTAYAFAFYGYRPHGRGREHGVR
jgi:hypothetical protein